MCGCEIASPGVLAAPDYVSAREKRCARSSHFSVRHAVKVKRSSPSFQRNRPVRPVRTCTAKERDSQSEETGTRTGLFAQTGAAPYFVDGIPLNERRVAAGRKLKYCDKCYSYRLKTDPPRSHCAM